MQKSDKEEKAGLLAKLSKIQCFCTVCVYQLMGACLGFK